MTVPMSGLGPSATGQTLSVSGIPGTLGVGGWGGLTTQAATSADMGALGVSGELEVVGRGAAGLGMRDIAEEAKKRRRLEETELEKKFQEQIVRRRYAALGRIGGARGGRLGGGGWVLILCL